MSFYLVSILLLTSSLNICRCWVINDIDLKYLKELENNSFEDDYELSPEDLARMRFTLTYPGTKWCGAGDIADGFDDLGTSVEADMCCREHDYCPDTIIAGETKHNITNTSYYTRLSCACDERFLECLHAANTSTSSKIGMMYFNIIGTKCYRQDFLVTGCKKKGGWLGTKCVEYSYDVTSKKVYQWFDLPKY